MSTSASCYVLAHSPRERSNLSRIIDRASLVKTLVNRFTMFKLTIQLVLIRASLMVSIKLAILYIGNSKKLTEYDDCLLKKAEGCNAVAWV